MLYDFHENTNCMRLMELNYIRACALPGCYSSGDCWLLADVSRHPISTTFKGQAIQAVFIALLDTAMGPIGRPATSMLDTWRWAR